MGMRHLLPAPLAIALTACAPAQLPRSSEPADLVIATTTDVHGRIAALWQNPGVMKPRVGGTAVSTPFTSGTRFLRIIATNDFHGALEPRPDANGVRRGGAAYVAAAIDRARPECAPRCRTLLLDAGDLFQGTPASNLSYGRPVVEYYNRMGYAASALGNHEFDWGTDTLRARMRQAK